MGFDDVGAGSSSQTLDTIGSLYLDLHEEDERDLTGTEIMEEIRRRTADLISPLCR